MKEIARWEFEQGSVQRSQQCVLLKERSGVCNGAKTGCF